eukprot:31102-Pelagococcus_subviridis.AAC.2
MRLFPSVRATRSDASAASAASRASTRAGVRLAMPSRRRDAARLAPRARRGRRLGGARARAQKPTTA